MARKSIQASAAVIKAFEFASEMELALRSAMLAAGNASRRLWIVAAAEHPEMPPPSKVPVHFDETDNTLSWDEPEDV